MVRPASRPSPPGARRTTCRVAGRRSPRPPPRALDPRRPAPWFDYRTARPSWSSSDSTVRVARRRLGVATPSPVSESYLDKAYLHWTRRGAGWAARSRGISDERFCMRRGTGRHGEKKKKKNQKCRTAYHRVASSVFSSGSIPVRNYTFVARVVHIRSAPLLV